jgi:hypothetical protein
MRPGFSSMAICCIATTIANLRNVVETVRVTAA